ncbi:MAG: hypothetical protein RR695_10900 [Clostridium sp.]
MNTIINKQSRGDTMGDLKEKRIKILFQFIVISFLIVGSLGGYILFTTVSSSGIESDVKSRLGKNTNIIERIDSAGEAFVLVKSGKQPGMKMLIYDCHPVFKERYVYKVDSFYTNDTKARSQEFGTYISEEFKTSNQEGLYVIFGDNSVIKGATLEVISDDGKVIKNLPEGKEFLYVFRTYNSSLLGNSFIDSNGDIIE